MRPLLHSRRLTWTLLVSSLVLATGASAAELTLSLDARGEYNSNLLGSSDNEKESYVSNMGPEIRVWDPYGRFTYEALYRGDFNWFASEPKLNGYQQYFEVEAAYALSRQTTISVSDSFRDLSSIRFLPQEEADGTSSLDGGRDRFLRNVFEAELSHAFNRRVSATLSLSNEELNYDDNERYTDTSYMSATGSLYYGLSRKDTVGGGGGFANQSFDAAGNRFASRGQTWNSFVFWSHRFDSDMKFTLQGGPSLVKSISSGKTRAPQEGSPFAGLVFVGPCGIASPGLPGAEEATCSVAPGTPSAQLGTVRVLGSDPVETDVTFFGKVALAKRWEDWEFNASYQRRQAGASGDGTISALDQALLSANYDADKLWSFYTSVGWSQRESIGRGFTTRIGGVTTFLVSPTAPGQPAQRVAVVGAPGNERLASNKQYSVILGTKRRLTKHISTDLTFRYRHQKTQRATDDGIDVDTNGRTAEFFLVGLSFSYEFDPVRF
jgi:hypothetical protein